MIEGLFQEGDEETILKMDFDEAVPLLVLMLDISEDEAFEMWKEHQRLTWVDYWPVFYQFYQDEM